MKSWRKVECGLRRGAVDVGGLMLDTPGPPARSAENVSSALQRAFTETRCHVQEELRLVE
jgi:hypothetical protein